MQEVARRGELRVGAVSSKDLGLAAVQCPGRCRPRSGKADPSKQPWKAPMTAQSTPLHGRASRQQALSVLLQRVRAEERAALAQELHDELGALLLAAKLNVAGLRARCMSANADVGLRFDHLSQLLDKGLALKTRVIDGLHPCGVLDLGLHDALRQLVKEFERDTGLAVRAQIDDLSLDASTQMGIYRFVQECLTNIGKHAHATRVSIEAWKDLQQVVVRITDNGVGFATGGIASSAHGLAGMRRRIRELGGRLLIETSAMQGARITAVIPRPAAGSRDARARQLPRLGRTGWMPTSGAARQSTARRPCTNARIGKD